MDIRKLSSFEDLEVQVRTEREFAHKQYGEQKYSPFLFRGQSDSNWKLESTLERAYKNKPFTMEEYHHVLRSISPIVMSLSSSKYIVPDTFEYNGLCAPPCYDFMIYLRHHGFPSPLLDWTSSPYIAAFFAFKNCCEEGEVSIFCFKEYLSGGKVWSNINPHIQGSSGLT